MRRPRLAFQLLALLCLTALAACEDPSGVGLTVLNPDETDPRARTIPADSVVRTPFDDVTGAFVATNNLADFRGLAGRAADPLFGTSEARAYIDFLAPQSFPEGFRSRPLEQVQLRLVRTYAYGDTTGAVTFDLFDVTEEWNAAGAVSDTLFPVAEAPFASFQVAAADSLVEVNLPADWIAANDTTLRHNSVTTLFHGFQIRPQEGAGAVFGFSARSQLRLISASDTVHFLASEIFSHVAWEPPAVEPEGFRPLQDGSGQGIQLTFDLDTLGSTPVSTAFLRIDVDTTRLVENLPPGFVRTRPQTLTLFARSDSDDGGLVTEARFDKDRSAYIFSGSTLTTLFQRLVLGQTDLDQFVLAFPTSPSSLDALPLVLPEAGPVDGPPRGPRAVLVVPTER